MPAGTRLVTLCLATFAACTGGGGTDPDPVDVDGGTTPTPDAADPGKDGGPSTDASPDAPPMVEELPPLGDGVGTLSGASVAGRIDGIRGIARFSNPVNVVSDGAGGVVVCDFDNHSLRRVDADGAASSPFTLPATFARPFGIVRSGDTLYVQTDRSTTGTPTGALWRITLSTGTATLVRDNVGRYRGLALLSDGRLVGAEYQQHVVSILDPSTGVATVLAGAAGQAGMLDATGAAARFDMPYDVVVLPGDEIVVADFGNDLLRKVSLDGSVVTYASGFTTPQGLALGAGGTIYVSDPEAGVVKAVASGGGAVTTVAGTGTRGYLDAENPLEAQLFGLEGLDVSADGAYLYVADGSGGEDLPYHRVRRLTIAP
ncbi:MAG: hypothetical protein F9K40_02885 [Kofleriaceae bacterium]|nr:MAG: hypothetical protein F9K40_02885 [Kofleriaceae bacterium]